MKEDGVGFDPLKVHEGEHPSGLGLMSMQEGAAAIDANCHVESSPGAGTRIVVDLKNRSSVG